jgi:hypothetical protein
MTQNNSVAKTEQKAAVIRDCPLASPPSKDRSVSLAIPNGYH